MKTTTLATFNDRAHAEPLKERLEAANIPVEIHDDSAQERLWFVGKPRAGVHLNVRAADYEKALGLIHAWDAANDALHDAVRCPECGSSRIEYPQFTRKFITPNVIGVLSAVGLVQKQYYCQDCQCIWPGADAKPPRNRAHMAPNYFIEDVPPAETAGGERPQP
jgi:predicted Zn-ribbon and HTH transcriptional regulator